VVHEIHDRYLVEVVEGFGLCPFARRSRELGRVHRPLLWGDARGGPDADAAVAALGAVARAHADAEIVLLTFVLPPAHSLTALARFEAFTAEVRERWNAGDARRFFMVPFHRDLGTTTPRDRPLTPDMLVPLIRRTPDPVIQCVAADVLERARAQAQESARHRLLERFAADKTMLALIVGSVQADSELSADIARHNFGAVAVGSGRASFERVIADILRARDEAYAAAAVSGTPSLGR
jgi:hypothetical protein